MPLGADTIQLDVLAADPVAPGEGQLWYNAITQVIRLRQNGLTVSLGTGGGGSIASGQQSGTTSTTTTSLTDVLLAGMTVTPPAGTYMVWFSGDWANTNNGNTGTMSVYAGGVQQLHSESPCTRTSAGAVYNFGCTSLVTVDGTQAIEGRWRTTGGTATNTRRHLMYLKVA